MKIRIQEQSAWAGPDPVYVIEIDGNRVRVCGKVGEGIDLPEEIELSNEGQKSIEGLLSLVALHDWKDQYRPEDAGSVVDDGGSWEVIRDDKQYSGENSGPSLADPVTTVVMEHDRFGVLRDALLRILRREIPFGWRPQKT